ncbi:phosphate/phosphite/phosphonate ABC transporter substrate-binding protein [Demequina zhanjiangensis]|uniref:Phosphate/phosphite/phosphonate ABC transporter substrate-binding protein n=1 Tax=Demequina zhanjiangensis TaxID=3051659 RepID=A0ABT8G053_9MICO|nr:phosphate/phosphite/phosphonate ABC transporter substrate-binding protein [Demequina sp. SYSU T00b26]MDN4472513.1 phosphate/phosphite/phosphonate ABC transporter substrate-binding protein [Demequina sp. SYSU T00b26]
MRKTLTTTGLVGVALLALVGCSTADGDTTATTDGSAPADAQADWPSEITLALIPNEQVNDLVTSVSPLTDYLTEELGIEVTGVVTKDYQAAVEAIGSGQAQIAIADAGSLAAAEDLYGAHAVLQDVRFGASSYASQFFTNIDNADKYCADEPVEATYAASGQTFLYCNGVASGEENTGVGPVSVDALGAIEPGTKVAFGNTTSPAGYQLPVLMLEELGTSIDDLEQVPVTGNDTLIMAVYNGDAEVGFSYWDARSSIDESEVPDLAEKIVVFGLSEMYPNGGVVLSDDLPEDLRAEITDLMDGYADVDPDTLSNIFGQTDWVPADAAAIDLARQVNARFSGQ